MYYPCGSKLKADTDKEISLNLLEFLDNEGLNVLASSFDAKSRDIMIRGERPTVSPSVIVKFVIHHSSKQLIFAIFFAKFLNISLFSRDFR